MLTSDAPTKFYVKDLMMMRRPKTANFDESWKSISRVTTAVMSESSVDRDEWCEQITSVYYLCMAMPTPLAETLYNKLKEYLIEHVQRYIHTTANVRFLFIKSRTRVVIL